jgi:predicted nuclease of restriction endonuclease-like (RecB) superfamily
MPRIKGISLTPSQPGYNAVLTDVVQMIEAARRTAAHSVNSVMTATYWAVGRRIVEHEQGGAHRAAYGEELLKKLAGDLTAKVGRGFSERNLEQMRGFFLGWPISQTASAKSPTALRGTPPLIPQTMSAVFLGAAADENMQKMLGQSHPATTLASIAKHFRLPWSQYVRLLSVRDRNARHFYEAEALRGGWTVRQLDRQINSQFYERTALSRNKAAMLRKGKESLSADLVTPEEELKEPYILEFMNLKDEYSETDLETALVGKLETFLLELGGDFTFVGRQRRLRVGDAWYRIDLLFFHRRLRCLVIIDLKLGKFTHADAGQMHLYLNYAREHWMVAGENPPVGLILCAEKDHEVAKYALEGLPNKVMAAQYKTTLPNERVLVEEIAKTRTMIEGRAKREPTRRKAPSRRAR